MKKALLGILGASVLGLTGLSASASANTVTVQQGDTVSKLASQYNTSVSAIQQLNNLANVNMIYVNEQLQVNNQAVTPSKSFNSTQQTNTSNNVQNSSNSSPQASTTTVASSSSEDSARNWIADHESGGSYTARNGQFIGKYQLSASYLNGDYSAANQERVANQYVASRYDSWQGALDHWKAYGWY